MSLTVCGIRTEVSFWFFAVLAAFVALSGGSSAFFCLALPVAAHEAGHLSAAAVTGTGIERIRLTAFGIEVVKSRGQRLKLGAELFVSFAGVLVNLAFAATLFFFGARSHWAALMTAANLVIAGFNLLPIGNLDGGEIARLVAEYFFKPRLAFLISRLFSFLTLVPLFTAAIFLLLRPERNFTLLLICIYLLVDVAANCR